MSGSNETAPKQNEHEKTSSQDNPNQEYSKEIIDIWKKVREIYKQQRDSKLSTEEYHVLSRFTERRRLETMEGLKGFCNKAYRVSAYNYRKRYLKQKIAIMLEQEDARIRHLEAKEARKSGTDMKKFIRRIRGYRPHEERIKRPRGRYGKEQGNLQQIKDIREKYQAGVARLYEHKVIHALSLTRIEQDIEKLPDQSSDPEVRVVLKSYQDTCYKDEGRFDDQFSSLRAELRTEMERIEKRIVKFLKKINWNDHASVGGFIITGAGSGLSVAGAVGAIP